MDAPDRIIRERECREMTSLSRATRHRMIRRGDFPASVPLTGAPWCRGWLLSEVQAWLRRQADQRDAERDAA